MGTFLKKFYICLNIALVAGFMTLAVTVTSTKVYADDQPAPTTTDDGSDDTDFACSPIFKIQL